MPLAPGPHPEAAPSWSKPPAVPHGAAVETAGTHRPGLPVALQLLLPLFKTVLPVQGLDGSAQKVPNRSLITCRPPPGQAATGCLPPFPVQSPERIWGRNGPSLPGSQTASDKLITTACCWQAGPQRPGPTQEKSVRGAGQQSQGQAHPRLAPARTHSSLWRRRPPSLCPQAHRRVRLPCQARTFKAHFTLRFLPSTCLSKAQGFWVLRQETNLHGLFFCAALK